MKSRLSGRKAIYWCAADTVTIGVAIIWPGWFLPAVTWLFLVAMFVCAGSIPVRRQM